MKVLAFLPAEPKLLEIVKGIGPVSEFPCLAAEGQGLFSMVHEMCSLVCEISFK